MKVKVVDYSEKAVAVFGAMSETESKILAANGMFCTNLKTTNGETRPGWIFSKKRSEQATKLAAEIKATLTDYSEKAVALFPEVENHVKELLKAKGMYNAHLRTEDGGTAPGWIFSKAHQEKVLELAKALAA